MKKIFPLIFLLCVTLTACSQPGYQIKVKTLSQTGDSLYVKSYNIKEKKFTKLIALKFEKELTFKHIEPLPAGIYSIELDTVVICEFLISDSKKQKFSITISEEDINVEGNAENQANRAYMKQMMAFDYQYYLVEEDFKQLQQKGLPNYMMQPYVDSLIKKADGLSAQKKKYQEKIIAENKGTLLASIIKSSIEVPQPPQSYYRDRARLAAYFAEHLFDTFPWEDERMLNTPILYNKMKTFGQQIFPLEPEVSIPIVLKALQESKKTTLIHYALFDFLEHEFGNYKSPYRDELLYIAMLKEILSFPNLEETRKPRYEYELNIIDKNQAGEIAPNFSLLMSTGETIEMYDIESEYLMLYFQNPDCPTCSELREKMKNLDILNQAIAAGKLKVVTVYFEAGEELWRNYLKTRALKNWQHAWNKDLQIEEQKLYDTRIIPMIMFLDKNKKIIKKDLLSNEVEIWLKKTIKL